MSAGPGKYDDLATYAREQSDADVVVVIVVGGVHGHGFSVQARGEEVADKLPTLLRTVADDIERSLRP